MKKLLCFTSLCLAAWDLCAGPYSPAAGQPGSTAIHMDDPQISAWADEVTSVSYGADVDNEWKTPQKALGEATGNAFDIVSLGRGGEIILHFPEGIANGPGWDFAVFENAFDHYFLELAFVEISSDGVHFFRFPSHSLTPTPIPAFGQIDATNVYNLAGKFIQGYGTAFDLEELGYHGYRDAANIKYVKIIDISGNGSVNDSLGNPIYDPYRTIGSAGFDLDAVGVRHTSPFPDATHDSVTGWSTSPWLGEYSGRAYPWLEHSEHGWWYLFRLDANSSWVWSFDRGWFWLSKNYYPWVFHAQLETWVDLRE